MYRIRLTSGEERALDGIEALTAAVRDGIVTAECAIYHQRADQWLSIAKHPHFERAVAAVAAAPRPAAATATPAPARPKPAEPAEPTDLDRTLELLDLLPDPTPSCGEEIELEPMHLEAPVPDAVRFPTEPSATLDDLVETSIPPLEPLVEPTPAPEPAPVAAAPAQPVRPARTRELDFVYVPETPLPPRPEPAPAPAPKPELKVAPKPEPKVAPKPAPVPAPAPVSTPATAPVEMREPVREPAPPAAPAAAREPDPVGPDDFDGFAAAAEEPAELADDFGARPDRPSGQRTAPTVDFSPLTEGQGSRRPALLAGLAVVALGAVLVVAKPWGSAADVAAAATPAPASAPAAAPADATPTAVTTSGAVAPSEPSAVPSGFGASDSNPRTARKESRAAEAAPSPDSARPFVPARPAVAAIELGALPASVTAAGPGGTVPVSRAVLARNYAAAYEAARAELQGRFADAGFRGLFDRSRLGSMSSMLAARKAVAEARSALKQYRSRETEIEQAYGDTLQLVGRKLALTGRDLAAWDVRGQRKESAEAAREAEQMLAQLDRVYGLLIAEEGHYQMSGDALAFADSSAAERYAELRGWIQQRRGGGSPSMREIVRAIGSAGLPEGRAP